MKKLNWLVGLICVLFALFLGNAYAQTIEFTKLIDTTVAIPNGAGYFTKFEAPYLYQGKIVFRGYGVGEQEGVYTNLNGSWTVVADKKTSIPDGTGHFIHFAEPTPYSKTTYHKYQILSFNSPAINNDSVIFIGEGKDHQEGVYLYQQNKLQKIADTHTDIPAGSGNFTHFYSPYLNNGNPAFVGEGHKKQQGMYTFTNNKLTMLYNQTTTIPASNKHFARFWNPDFAGGHVAFWGIDKAKHVGIYDDVTGKLRRIADQKTPIPNGNGNFVMLGAPSLQNSKVTFRGIGRNEQNGVYSNISGELQEIATTNTPIPQGEGNFTGAYNPTIDADNIVFIAKGAKKQAGIYAYYQGNLKKVIAFGDELDGKKVKSIALGAVALSGAQVAFQAVFEDGSEAIYLATLT